MKVERRVSRARALCALACLAVAAVGGALAPGARATSAPWHATIVADGFGFGDCCTFTTTISDANVAVPRIGNASLDGSEFYCGEYAGQPLCSPDADGTTFTLRFSTPSGELDIAGFTPRGSTDFRWSVVGGTRRFADASGSGTYRATIDPATVKVVVSLDGSLLLRGAGSTAG